MFNIDVYWILKTVAVATFGYIFIRFCSGMGKLMVKNDTTNWVKKISEGDNTKNEAFLWFVFSSVGTGILAAIIALVSLRSIRGFSISVVAFILCFPTMLYTSIKTLISELERESNTKRQREQEDLKL